MTNIKSVQNKLTAARDKIKAGFTRCKQLLLNGKDIIVLFLTSEPYRWDNKANNRRLIITLTSLFLLNYAMFCYHADKNIFAIFPNIPPISSQHKITIFLPSLDGETIISEKRKTADFASEERFIRFLFNNVVEGSMFQNTAIAVPVEMSIRNIWLLEQNENTGGKKICAIDCDITVLETQVSPLPESKPLFRKALTQTITANIPDISDVLLLEGGMPDKNFW